MKAAIVSVGDELVLGQTVDTNSAWLSALLASAGVATEAHVTVGDDQAAIERALREWASRVDLLIVSGGLGPTDDDLTRQALAAALGAELRISEPWLVELRRFFEARGRAMPDGNRIQAMIPAGATLLWNHAGTAAGIRARIGGCEVFSVPGVPKEMKQMVEREVLPDLRRAGGGAAIVSRTLHTFGMGESAVAEKLGDLMRRGRNPSVGTTVSGGVVSLRVNARFESASRAAEEAERAAALCRAALGTLIYGEDGASLSDVVGGMLRERGLRLATAESCTGGLLGKYVTDVAGSSDYFEAGFIAYSNRAKHERLGVSENLLHVHGAVSEPVVLAMARAARRLARADLALAISGIAGPGGGTPAKPVGTTCIALAWGERKDLAPDAGGALARSFSFPGDREMVRDRAAKMALTMLRYHLLGEPMPV